VNCGKEVFPFRAEIKLATRETRVFLKLVTWKLVILRYERRKGQCVLQSRFFE